MSRKDHFHGHRKPRPTKRVKHKNLNFKRDQNRVFAQFFDQVTIFLLSSSPFQWFNSNVYLMVLIIEFFNPTLLWRRFFRIKSVLRHLFPDLLSGFRSLKQFKIDIKFYNFFHLKSGLIITYPAVTSNLAKLTNTNRCNFESQLT